MGTGTNHAQVWDKGVQPPKKGLIHALKLYLFQRTITSFE